MWGGGEQYPGAEQNLARKWCKSGALLVTKGEGGDLRCRKG